MSQTKGTVELIFRTRWCSWAREAVEVDRKFYVGPFRHIEAILSERQSMWPRISPVNKRHAIQLPPLHFAVQLPILMVDRLFEYGRTRLNGVKLPTGNCHEFASFMAGNDEAWMTATRRMNDLLPTSQPLPGPETGTIHVPAGHLVLIAHPDHEGLGPVDEHGQRTAGYGENGHGPIRVAHTCLSIGNLEGTLDAGDSWAIHRVALDGALAIDPLPNILRGYRDIGGQVRRDHWAHESAPSREDFGLYCVT